MTDCSTKQTNEQTGESSAGQTSPPAVRYDATQPDVVIYAQIDQNPDSDNVYANDPATSNNSGAVIYSELGPQHDVAPSGDLYAQVKKP